MYSVQLHSTVYRDYLQKFSFQWWLTAFFTVYSRVRHSRARAARVCGVGVSTAWSTVHCRRAFARSAHVHVWPALARYDTRQYATGTYGVWVYGLDCPPLKLYSMYTASAWCYGGVAWTRSHAAACGLR